MTAAAAAGLWMGFAECADCPMLLQPGARPLTQCPVSRLPASPWRLPGLDEQPLLLPSPLQRRVHPQARGGCVRCGPGGRRLAAHAGGGPGRPAVRVRLEQGGWAGWGFWWAGEEEQHRQLLCSATCLSLVAQAEIVGRALQCKPDLPAALPALTCPPAVWAVRRGQQRRSGGGTAASAGAPGSRHLAGARYRLQCNSSLLGPQPASMAARSLSMTHYCHAGPTAPTCAGPGGAEGGGD